MRKLTNSSKYEIDVDGDAVIYLRLKATGKWIKAYTCHPSCIPEIKKSGKLHGNDGCVLIYCGPGA